MTSYLKEEKEHNVVNVHLFKKTQNFKCISNNSQCKFYTIENTRASI